MNKKIIVLQDNDKECGSACLLSLIRYYGGDMPLSKIVEMTKTDKKGTNFYEMSLSANEIGFDVKGYKVEKESVNTICIPFIAHINNNSYLHFVVVYKVTNNKVIVMDPAKGKVEMKKEDFLNIFTGHILLLKPNKKIAIYKSDNYLKNILLDILFSNKKLIFHLVFLSVLFTILTCIYSFYFKIIIDQLQILSNLKLVTLIFLVIVIIKSITDYFRNYLLIYLNQKIDLSLILNTFQKILLLPYNYYKNKTTGEVIARINDLSQVKNLVSKIFVVIFLDVFITLIGGFILFLISKILFLYLVIISLVYVLIFYIFKPFIKKLTTINQENNAKVNSLLVESISGFESIKGLNLEEYFESQMEELYIKSIDDVVKLDKISSLESFLKNLVEAIGLLLITYMGCILILDGDLTLGSLITFNSLLVYFINPIRSIIDTSKDYYYASSSIKRANNLLNVEGDKIDNKTDLVFNGDILVKNLNFAYRGQDLILNNITLNIKKGEKVLIRGKSGSGKSTFLKILYGYYKINRDTIYINDIDYNDYSLGDIRKNMGYISQSETLYTDTIKNNIILKRNVNDKEFISVCKDVYVDDIIKDTFLGYDTLLEENGVNISGGQRQRIVLARMLLKKCNILMIDEALNQIDISLERKILKNIFEIYKDKTIIIVSHRFDNMDLYDKVITISNGKISEILERNNDEERNIIM